MVNSHEQCSKPRVFFLNMEYDTTQLYRDYNKTFFSGSLFTNQDSIEYHKGLFHAAHMVMI